MFTIGPDMRNRIVYIMNVDWDWAKQRPHFLAAHLSTSNDILVIYPFAWKRRYLSTNDRNGVKLYPFFLFPLGRRFAIIRRLNIFVLRMIARIFFRWYRPDFVWISSPELFDYLPKHLSTKLIYDCMDDILAFPRNEHCKGSLSASERELVNSSFLVICSSNNLRDKLIARAGHPEKYSVVHNAFEPTAFSSASEQSDSENRVGAYVLGYVGTISSWLDFEVLIKIVDEFALLEIHLMGPIENLVAPFPKHERIKYLGTVRHEDIQTRVSGFDALLMPFQVTDLVQSVDPVKLYEYIYFNKPIVSVKYAEIERFTAFVDFYTEAEGLISILDRFLTEGFRKKYSDSERLKFISSNTWSNRAHQIQEILSLSFSLKEEQGENGAGS